MRELARLYTVCGCTKDIAIERVTPIISVPYRLGGLGYVPSLASSRRDFRFWRERDGVYEYYEVCTETKP